MIKLLSLLLLIFGQSAVAASCAKPLVMFVPGFFNSTPSSPYRYFSKDIVNTTVKFGALPIVVDSLNPTGSVSENGETLIHILKSTERKFPGCDINVIAHSAGGLYTAYAVTRYARARIKQVITLSTPYSGVTVLDHISHIPFSSLVRSFLVNLKELEMANIKSVLQPFRIPSRIRWVALGGVQKPCRFFGCMSSKKLSWVLSVAWKRVRQPGDGVISYKSATSPVTSLLNENNSPFTIEKWNDLVIPLEHWEMVLDAGFFRLLNMTHLSWLRGQQRLTYQEILGRMNL